MKHCIVSSAFSARFCLICASRSSICVARVVSDACVWSCEFIQCASTNLVSGVLAGGEMGTEELGVCVDVAFTRLANTKNSRTVSRPITTNNRSQITSTDSNIHKLIMIFTPPSISPALAEIVIKQQNQSATTFRIAISGGSIPKLLWEGLQHNSSVQWEKWYEVSVLCSYLETE